MWEFFLGICFALRLDKKIPSQAMKGMFKAFLPYDKDISENMDILSAVGFCLAVCMLLRCEPGSLIWFAPLCSSWVFMSSSKSGRSKKKPLGDQTVPSIA
jgi:hypothetical protein